MQVRSSVGISIVVLAFAAMSGCAPGVEAQTVHGEAAMDDSSICSAYGDVLTILANADLGLEQARMESQEHTGWYQLATRVLDRLPSSGDSAVHSAIAELQVVAPAIPTGSGENPTGVRSPQWVSAERGLGNACDVLGVPLEMGAFTGG